MTDRPRKSSERLRAALAKQAEPQLDRPKPGSTWELFADERLTHIEADIAAIRSRVESIVWAVIGAVALGAIKFVTDLL